MGSSDAVARRQTKLAMPESAGVAHMKPLLKARKGGLLLRFAFAATHFGALRTPCPPSCCLHPDVHCSLLSLT